MSDKTYGWVMWLLGWIAGFCSANIIMMLIYWK